MATAPKSPDPSPSEPEYTWGAKAADDRKKELAQKKRKEKNPGPDGSGFFLMRMDECTEDHYEKYDPDR